MRTPYLSQGSTGSQVKAMQAMLRVKGGNPNLVVDGDFGPQTDHWLRDFQAYYQLGVDGVVGPISWQALVDS